MKRIALVALLLVACGHGASIEVVQDLELDYARGAVSVDESGAGQAQLEAQASVGLSLGLVTGAATLDLGFDRDGVDGEARAKLNLAGFVGSDLWFVWDTRQHSAEFCLEAYLGADVYRHCFPIELEDVLLEDETQHRRIRD